MSIGTFLAEREIFTSQNPYFLKEANLIGCVRFDSGLELKTGFRW